MKMTPEQEAFYELGAAKAFLYHKIDDARNYARQDYGESYGDLTPKERADCCKRSRIKFFIKLVRERRAACRAWNPPDGRDCPNCFYSSNRRCKLPCSQCWGHCLWEPRKEGE